MMPPSTREIMNSVGSKYAVVVGIAKKARAMSAKKELEETEGCLANMVNHTLEALIDDKLTICHAQPEPEEEPMEETADEMTEPEETSAEEEETAEENEPANEEQE